MNFIMIGLLLREALERLRVRLNMYFVGLRSRYTRRLTAASVVDVQCEDSIVSLFHLHDHFYGRELAISYTMLCARRPYR